MKREYDEFKVRINSLPCFKIPNFDNVWGFGIFI